MPVREHLLSGSTARRAETHGECRDVSQAIHGVYETRRDVPERLGHFSGVTMLYVIFWASMAVVVVALLGLLGVGAIMYEFRKRDD